MRARNFPHDLLSAPRVVAAVHTLGGLRSARRLRPGEVDVVEIRADALASHLAELERALPAIHLPVLLTVRHPAEGGVGGLTTPQRRAIFRRFLPSAALVDLDLRSLPGLADVAEEVLGRGGALIVSSHHFRSTPSLAGMLELQRRAFRAGATVFKLAAAVPTAALLARLLDLSARSAPGPRALMGMGPLGQVSRLALAAAGSVLNYGYLDEPNAPGQWEARELRRLLDRLGK